MARLVLTVDVAPKCSVRLCRSEVNRMTLPKKVESVGKVAAETWFKRFTYVFLFNALLAAVWTIPVLVPGLNISKTIAGGSAGTWGFVGYISFLVVGVGLMFVSGLAYYEISKVTGGRPNDKLAWAHLILLEAGTLVATALLAVSGYQGGTMLLAKKPIPEIHESIVVYVVPISITIGMALLGSLAGIVNMAMALRSGRK